MIVAIDGGAAAGPPVGERTRRGAVLANPTRRLHNQLAAEQAAAGEQAAARRSLASLRAFEPAALVGAKMLALELQRRRYGALRSRVTG